MVEDFVEPDVRLNYDSGTAGEYAGLDRFGRVIDQLWYDYGASANRDQFTYSYDRAPSGSIESIPAQADSIRGQFGPGGPG